MQQTQQEGSSVHAEDDHMGSEKRQRSLRHAHHSPCGAASRPAQEGVPKPAGSLIMAAAPGGRQKARFLCTEAWSGVGTILCSSVIPPYTATEDLLVRLLRQQ